jgi:twitching motility protein PilT
MLLGTSSKSSIIDVIQYALTEIGRATGVPSEIRITSKYCTVAMKSPDLSKRVDIMTLTFTCKEDTTAEAVEQALVQNRVKGKVKIEDKICEITAPPFEWHQLSQLKPLQDILDKHSRRTIRSLTWELEVRKHSRQGVNINVLLEEMQKRNASDLHLRAGNRPFIRVDNDLMPLDYPMLSSEDMKEVFLQMGGQQELELLDSERESSFQYHSVGLGFFRCSGYVKTNSRAIAIRHIPEDVPAFDTLGLPDSIKKNADQHRGLFLVCGITGSGKSTTLASLIDMINKSRKSHIITIEDPIEFVYKEDKAIISQRQVGRDTFSFANALRGALREDPDVILVGEMRDVDTIRSGLSAAETGHLVFSTLHTTTAADTVNRLISYFPHDERDLIRQELAYALQGVVCQRLLKRKEGGRIACVEILLGQHPIIKEAIQEGDLDKISGMIENDMEMTSFDQYAVKLYQEGLVTREEAISACSDAQGFERIMSGIKSSGSRKTMKGH